MKSPEKIKTVIITKAIKRLLKAIFREIFLEVYKTGKTGNPMISTKEKD